MFLFPSLFETKDDENATYHGMSQVFPPKKAEERIALAFFLIEWFKPILVAFSESIGRSETATRSWGRGGETGHFAAAADACGGGGAFLQGLPGWFAAVLVRPV